MVGKVGEREGKKEVETWQEGKEWKGEKGTGGKRVGSNKLRF